MLTHAIMLTSRMGNVAIVTYDKPNLGVNLRLTEFAVDERRKLCSESTAMLSALKKFAGIPSQRQPGSTGF